MTQTQSNTRCFAHRHMPGMAYAVYNVCLSWSRQKDGDGILYCNGRKLAAQFEGMSKNTFYRYCSLLEERGWFILLRPSKRLWDGTWSARHYQVLSHDEWAARHSGKCEEWLAANLEHSETPVPNSDHPVPYEGMDAISPVPNNAHPVPNLASTSPTFGTELIPKLIKKLIQEPIQGQPVPHLGTEVSAFTGRFDKSRRQSKTPKGQHVTGAPVPNPGLDVLNTYSSPLPMDLPSRVKRLTTPLMNTLGITYPGPKASWHRTIENLAKVYSDEDIRSVIRFSEATNRKAMLHPDHGATEFEKSFPYIDQHIKQQQQQQQAEREGVTQ